jgi:hypothetical protein
MLALAIIALIGFLIVIALSCATLVVRIQQLKLATGTGGLVFGLILTITTIIAMVEISSITGSFWGVSMSLGPALPVLSISGVMLMVSGVLMLISAFSAGYDQSPSSTMSTASRPRNWRIPPSQPSQFPPPTGSPMSLDQWSPPSMPPR